MEEYLDFKTVARGIKQCETEYYPMNELNCKPGVFYLIGFYKGRYEVLFVRHGEDLGSEIGIALWEYTSMTRTEYILTYAIVQDKSQRLQAYIDLFKRFQPVWEFTRAVDKRLKQIETTRMSKLTDIEAIGENKILEKYIGNIEFYKNLYNWSEFFIFSVENPINYSFYKIETQLKEKRGVYFIYGGPDNELLYIGISKNIKSRLISHKQKLTNTVDIADCFKHIKAIYLDININELDKLETYLINTLKPKCNINKVYTYNTDRCNPKYNSVINKFGDFKGYIRYLIAREKCKKQYYDYIEKSCNERVLTLEKEIEEIKNNSLKNKRIFDYNVEINNLKLR